MSLEDQISGALKADDPVFIGRITGIVESGGDREVTFRVSEFWSSNIPETFVVLTAALTSSCRYPFQEGNSYLIFSRYWEGKPRAGLCLITRELGKASNELKILGKGKIPQKKKP